MYLHIKFSNYFLILRLGFITATLLVIFFLPCVIMLKILFVLCVICYARFILTKSELKELHKENKEWKVKLGEEIVVATLAKDSVVTTKVCVLRFKIPQQRLHRTFVLFRDSFRDADDFRKLILACRNRS